MNLMLDLRVNSILPMLWITLLMPFHLTEFQTLGKK